MRAADFSLSDPSVVIVGAPNVGKSRLFNRLAGGKRALVHATPGLTRDRLEARMELGTHTVRLVDTGGLVLRPADDLARQVERQAREAAAEASLVLFVVDLKSGLTPLDRHLASQLRKFGRPILLVLNKVDAHKRAEENRSEIWSLGFGDGVEVSAEHAIGMAELLEAVEEILGGSEAPAGEAAPEEASKSEPEAIPVAIVGRPNAGKSSLFNRLLGRERAIVNPIPGTTHDRLEARLERAGRVFRLIDTAGLRRGARVSDPVEALSAAAARGAVAKSAIVLLVLDAQRGIDRQDLAVGGLALRSYRPLVVALNKADLLQPKRLAELRRKAASEFDFARYAPRVAVSALSGRGVTGLLSTLAAVWEEGGLRVPTSALNRILAEFLKRAPATPRARRVRPLYVTQEGVHPPSFIVFARGGGGRVHFSYRRGLENFLRKRLALSRTPMILRFRGGR
jgi:GTP-binding protein